MPSKSISDSISTIETNSKVVRKGISDDIIESDTMGILVIRNRSHKG